MARNLKREYLRKLVQIETKNGYKVDLGNYVSNPSFEHEYPGLRKMIEETPEKITYSNVYYFKYYDGTGEYIHKIYSAPNTGETWNIVKVESETKLEASNRFNLNKLVQLAESI